ncbi:CBASS oligonucleotide cyclase [Halocola ammonii]
MQLKNSQLQIFVDSIKLRRENMPKYRDQFNNLISRLEDKIHEDESTGLKVTKVIRAGSWKKGTILRSTGDNPIDVDLVFVIEGDDAKKDDIEKLHDFVVQYLEDIYPTKDISKDVDADGKTKAVKIVFINTGLEVDIVPVVPIENHEDYVWQPERGGGGTYTTSIIRQIDFSKERKNVNPNIASIIRIIKWWNNYMELDDFMPSFAIELIISYLDLAKGTESNIEEAIIRFFQYTSSGKIDEINFKDAINEIPDYNTPLFIGDPANNENNIARKISEQNWKEFENEALNAFETLNIAQSLSSENATVEEWKTVFGPKFKIKKEEE